MGPLYVTWRLSQRLELAVRRLAAVGARAQLATRQLELLTAVSGALDKLSSGGSGDGARCIAHLTPNGVRLVLDVTSADDVRPRKPVPSGVISESHAGSLEVSEWRPVRFA